MSCSHIKPLPFYKLMSTPLKAKIDLNKQYLIGRSTLLSWTCWCFTILTLIRLNLSYSFNFASQFMYASTVIHLKIVGHKPFRWWPSSKNLRSRGLLPLWSQVRALWLLIWWPLEAYMVVNFRARGISRGACKLTRTPTLNKKQKTKKWLVIS